MHEENLNVCWLSIHSVRTIGEGQRVINLDGETYSWSINLSPLIPKITHIVKWLNLASYSYSLVGECYLMLCPCSLTTFSIVLYPGSLSFRCLCLATCMSEWHVIMDSRRVWVWVWCCHATNGPPPLPPHYRYPLIGLYEIKCQSPATMLWIVATIKIRCEKSSLLLRQDQPSLKVTG